MPPDREAAVLNHVRTHGSISRREVVELWVLSENQAAHLLKKLVEQGELHMAGRGCATRYGRDTRGFCHGAVLRKLQTAPLIYLPPHGSRHLTLPQTTI